MPDRKQDAHEEMHHEQTSHEELLTDPTVHHEERDINFRWVFITIGLFAVFTIISYLLMFGLFKWFQVQERHKDGPAVSEVAGALDRRIPPSPRLQPFPEPVQTPTGQPTYRDPVLTGPVAVRKEMERRQREQLDSYGWVDRPGGIVRIPISEAKRLMVERGVAIRQIPAAAPVDEQTGGAPAEPAAIGSPQAPVGAGPGGLSPRQTPQPGAQTPVTQPPAQPERGEIE
jgi:hypothetical protein